MDKRMSWSGPCPDLIATQRSRDGVSSAAKNAGRHAIPCVHSTVSAALDSSGSAPLTKPFVEVNAPSCQLLTARAVAELLDVCTETVLRWIRDGELPALRLPGGAIRIATAELNEWLMDRATPRRGVLATGPDAAATRRYSQE